MICICSIFEIQKVNKIYIKCIVFVWVFVTVSLYLQTTGKNAHSLVLEGEITEPEQQRGEELGRIVIALSHFFSIFLHYPFLLRFLIAMESINILKQDKYQKTILKYKYNKRKSSHSPHHPALHICNQDLRAISVNFNIFLHFSPLIPLSFKSTEGYHFVTFIFYFILFLKD